MAVGCTGGRHRSVALAEELAERIRARGYDPVVYHRDIEPMTPAMPRGRDRPTWWRLGGGHGLATTLQAVRRYAGRVTAVVSVADDGGSSGRLRQIAGIPAPGDLRRCLVAMADRRSLWARAFEYRFPAGDLEGHALGNLVIAGLANVTGDFGQALDLAAGLLGAVGPGPAGHVGAVVLKADVAGREVRRPGQRVRRRRARSRRSRSSRPTPPSRPRCSQAIADADQVVIGPGSLFTSVLAVCAVPAIRAALPAGPGGRVYVCNLRPQLARDRRASPPRTTCGPCSTTASRST